MTTHKFTGEPEFICAECEHEMCNDCKSAAEEYEYLAQQRGFELARLYDQIEELNRIIERQQRAINAWKEIAAIPYPQAMHAWLDAEAAKASKKGRVEMRRELRKAGLLREQIAARVESALERDKLGIERTGQKLSKAKRSAGE